MTSCKRIRERALRELDRELSVDEALELDAHVAECEACRAFVARAQRLEEALVRLGEPPVERLDVERQLAAIRARIDARPERDEAPRPWSAARISALAAGLALLAGSAALLWLKRDERGPAKLEQVAERGPAEPASSDVAPELDQPPADESPSNDALAAAVPPDSTPPAARPDAEPVSDEPRIDPAKRDAAIEGLWWILAECGPSSGAVPSRDDCAAFVAQVDQLARERGLGAWPIARLAQNLLDDERVGGAALCYVAWRGDRLAAAELEKRAADDRAALLVRIDTFEGGSEAVSAACAHPGRAALALERLSQRGAELQVRTLEEALRMRPSSSERALVLARLAALGSLAVEPIARACAAGLLAADESALALRSIPDSAARLAAVAPRSGNGPLAWIPLAEACAAPELAAWLEGLVREPRTRAAALAALERCSHPSFAERLIALATDGLVQPDALDRAVGALARREPGATRELTASVLAQGPDERSLLVDALASCSMTGAAPGLIAFAGHPGAPLDERELALDALADLAPGISKDDAQPLAEELVALFRGLGERERRLAAACVVALNELGGDAAVERLLGGAPRRASQRVLEILAESPVRSVSRVQLARALEPCLDARRANPSGGNL